MKFPEADADTYLVYINKAEQKKSDKDSNRSKSNHGQAHGGDEFDDFFTQVQTLCL
jgi:hypothetical protein